MDTAGQVIDGEWVQPHQAPEKNRWHSSGGKSYPHWVWIRFRQAARIEYRRALEIAPDLPEIRVRLADLELEGRNWEAAGRLFKEELAKDPSSYLSYFGLARLSFEQMDLAGTIKYLNEAAGIRPEFFESLPNFSTSLPKEKLASARREIEDKVEDFGRAFLLAAIAAELGEMLRWQCLE